METTYKRYGYFRNDYAFLRGECMNDIEFSNALYQISEILAYSEEIKDKLPRRLIDFIESNKSSNYNWKFDPYRLLEEQGLLQDTTSFLTIIYRNYMCDDFEKNELDRALIENKKRGNNKH
jgi:hypothetical protein